MSIEERAEKRYEDTMAERDTEVYGTLWTPWRDLPAYEQDYWVDVVRQEELQARNAEPIWLTDRQAKILSDALMLDPDPSWRERVLVIPGRHTARTDRVELSTPYLEGWLSPEEIEAERALQDTTQKSSVNGVESSTAPEVQMTGTIATSYAVEWTCDGNSFEAFYETPEERDERVATLKAEEAEGRAQKHGEPYAHDVSVRDVHYSSKFKIGDDGPRTGEGTSLELAIGATVALAVAKTYSEPIQEFFVAGHRHEGLSKGSVSVALEGGPYEWTITWPETADGKACADEYNLWFEPINNCILAVHPR